MACFGAAVFFFRVLARKMLNVRPPEVVIW